MAEVSNIMEYIDTSIHSVNVTLNVKYKRRIRYGLFDIVLNDLHWIAAIYNFKKSTAKV